jgi:superfamily II DNA helicase RecQ
MEYHYFKIGASHPEPDQALLNTFLAAHKVLNISQQFVADGGNSFWSLCISISTSHSAALAPHNAHKTNKRNPIDYRELLSPTDFAQYAALRSLRKTLSEQQAIPPYSIFTNEQLANIIRLDQPTKTNLNQIDGIGDKRIAQYADVFIKALLEARALGKQETQHA